MLNRLLLWFRLALVSLCGWASWSTADVRVTLVEPSWEFLQHNAPRGPNKAQLTSNEASFARTLQPLLAKADYAAVLELFGKRELRRDSPALRLLRGQVLLSMKRYGPAAEALLSALEDMPDLALAHRSLSLVYLAQKQYAQARTHLQRTIELGVADAQVYGQLAYVNLQLGRAASAVAGYQYALFLDDANGQWQQGLLYSLIQSQAFDQAQGLLDEMLQADFSNADLWLQRGQIALRQGRPQQAIASLETAIKLGDQQVDNLVTAVQLHIQSGSSRRAVALISQYQQQILANDAAIPVLEQVASWLASQQEWANLQSLLTALDRQGSTQSRQVSGRFNVHRAQLALAQGNTELALNKLGLALEFNPTDGEALLQLANLLQQQQFSERALLYYVRAEALDEFRERAQLGRAQLEIDRHNYAQALSILRLVVQANPQRSELLANIKSLEQLVRQQG